MKIQVCVSAVWRHLLWKKTQCKITAPVIMEQQVDRPSHSIYDM